MVLLFHRQQHQQFVQLFVLGLTILGDYLYMFLSIHNHALEPIEFLHSTYSNFEVQEVSFEIVDL